MSWCEKITFALAGSLIFLWIGSLLACLAWIAVTSRSHQASVFFSMLPFVSGLVLSVGGLSYRYRKQKRANPKKLRHSDWKARLR